GPGISDPRRQLTDEGIKRFADVIKFLRRQCSPAINVIYHNPWIRAQQSAALLNDVLQCKIQETAYLAQIPDFNALKRLNETPAAWIGHEPWLSQIAAWLAFANMDLSRGIKLKKGGILWLQGEFEPSG